MPPPSSPPPVGRGWGPCPPLTTTFHNKYYPYTNGHYTSSRGPNTPNAFQTIFKETVGIALTWIPGWKAAYEAATICSTTNSGWNWAGLWNHTRLMGYTWAPRVPPAHMLATIRRGSRGRSGPKSSPLAFPRPRSRKRNAWRSIKQISCTFSASTSGSGAAPNPSLSLSSSLPSLRTTTSPSLISPQPSNSSARTESAWSGLTSADPELGR